MLVSKFQAQFHPYVFVMVDTGAGGMHKEKPTNFVHRVTKINTEWTSMQEL